MLKTLMLELTDECLAGSNTARRTLLDLGCADGLRGVSSTLNAVADYVEYGFSIVPQVPGEKKPCVRWRPFQAQAPTVAELFDWFNNWRSAGIAVVLGRVSHLFAIDVDGPEAHAELIRRLGTIPHAPMSLSGSRKPQRYHLFFRYPDLETKAKATPWHKNLEFRGERGIVVLPPSKHPSGHRYCWRQHMSLRKIGLPHLPEAILATLANEYYR